MDNTTMCKVTKLCGGNCHTMRLGTLVLQEPFAVNGSVQITVNMTRSSPCIVLHAANMDISHVALEDPHTHGARCTGSSHPQSCLGQYCISCLN
jgi:hypothetical protein